MSLEIIADDDVNAIRQGKILSKLGKNVFVKIPIMFTNGKSTKNVIRELVSENINLNITAIFTLKQIKEIMPIIKKLKPFYQFLVEDFMTLELLNINLKKFQNM